MQSTAPLTPEECLSQLDIRVGRIVDVWNHPESDKLLCEKVDVGEAVPRSIGSGIRAFHSAEEIKGRLVCVMCNLKQKKLGGYPSNGMLLCASVMDHSRGALLDPPEGSIVGERISFPGIVGEPATPAQVHKKRMLESVLPVYTILRMNRSISKRIAMVYAVSKIFLSQHLVVHVPVIDSQASKYHNGYVC